LFAREADIYVSRRELPSAETAGLTCGSSALCRRVRSWTIRQEIRELVARLRGGYKAEAIDLSFGVGGGGSQQSGARQSFRNGRIGGMDTARPSVRRAPRRYKEYSTQEYLRPAYVRTGTSTRRRGWAVATAPTAVPDGRVTMTTESSINTCA